MLQLWWPGDDKANFMNVEVQIIEQMDRTQQVMLDFLRPTPS